jgi:putative transposase
MPGKKIWGRKRHVLVDTLGLPMAVVVHAADVADREGVQRLLAAYTAQDFPRLQLIWADQGYTGEVADWIREHLGCRLEIVKPASSDEQSEWVWKHGKMTRKRTKAKGFQVLPRRWVVERTFAWISRHRRLARDFEGLPTSSEAFIQLALSRLMLSRLVPPFP